MHKLFPLTLCATMSRVVSGACIEYLAQPFALQEVGLFRVSGNKKKILECVSAMRTLNAHQYGALAVRICCCYLR